MILDRRDPASPTSKPRATRRQMRWHSDTNVAHATSGVARDSKILDEQGDGTNRSGPHGHVISLSVREHSRRCFDAASQSRASRSMSSRNSAATCGDTVVRVERIAEM
jgi:hypothetical protein